MVLTRKTPRFTCDNNLAAFINLEEEEFTLEEMTLLIVDKLELISNMHSSMLKCGPRIEEATQKLCCAKRQTRV